MEVCTCPKCINYQFTDENGKQNQGPFVSKSTRNRQWAAASLQDQDNSSRLSEIVLEEISDNNSIVSPETSETHESPSHSKRPTSEFITWLYLSVGVSREKCRVAREYLVQIVTFFQADNYSSIFKNEIPKDVRTILRKLDVTPQFNKHVCCPTCYSVYDIDTSPFDCGYQDFPHSSPCGESLFIPLYIKPTSYVQGHLHSLQTPPKSLKDRTPFLTYITQDFVNWLMWFIPQVEESIDEWRQKVQVETNSISDYQQSPSWKNLYPPSQTAQASAMPLSFSLFVDWFNPMAKKLGGKQVSLGVLALNCLNLPATKRWKLQNTFLSAIIPAPNQPNMVTINNVLSLFVEEIMPLSAGINIPTPRYPNGRKVVIKLGCLIGDLVATHKVAGYASHSATCFCTWCDCNKDNIKNLEIGRLRQSRIVKDYAYSFKQAQNQAERDRILKRAGVRWSELHRLPYWDPVNHVSLGVMHMWYEGILQNHFFRRWQWSFGKSGKPQQETDTNESHQESSSDENDDEMIIDEHSKKIEGLSSEQVKKFQSLFEEVIVPTGITRIPSNAGAPKTGKMKASEWKSLFSIYLPLVSLDVFLGDFDSIESTLPSNWLLLKNLCALVTCTNILIYQSITQDNCKSFLHHYKTYCKTSEVLFSNCKIKPNHHYALHVKTQLLWWGPLRSISEHSGERLNGFLQKFKNNGKADKFGLTIMNRFCQWQRLTAKSSLTKENPNPSSDPEMDFSLDRETYLKLLSYLQMSDSKIRDHMQIPHPEGAKVFPNHAKEIKTLQCNNGLHTFNVSAKPPNNIIKYKTNDGILRYGSVNHILKTVWEPSKNSFILVGNMKKIEYSPTKNKLIWSIFDSLAINQLRKIINIEVIQGNQVVGLCAYRQLPAWSLGVKEPTMLVRLIKEGHSPLSNEEVPNFG
ncbi:hypothetical protein O181_018102 [Austropuccinia psidii MF-1]|uniref:Transposase domain-containing protein n=1 Tax=Austropuccinia psidii MF-1 TaxID=1389203 RepID=A0A9Q3C769_9BASI|nr:hypothetical protein [Austropuccinia psidii MF-1]